MQTRIISAFPGSGKTTYCIKYPGKALDSDSSLFSWIDDAKTIRNPAFPNNYIQYIKDNIGKYDFIFVSTHAEVRKALLDNCLFFYLIYPLDSRKEEFLQRYQDNGSPESFIKLLSSHWDMWIRACDFCERGCKRVSMSLKNLEDELNHIERSEYGEE